MSRIGGTFTSMPEVPKPKRPDIPKRPNENQKAFEDALNRAYFREQDRPIANATEPLPQLYDVQGGQWVDAEPRQAEGQFGVHLGPPRSGQEQEWVGESPLHGSPQESKRIKNPTEEWEPEVLAQADLLNRMWRRT